MDHIEHVYADIGQLGQTGGSKVNLPLLKDYKFLSKNLMTQVTVSVFSS
jgi:hypothetical protein